jgi:hypothetical protein
MSDLTPAVQNVRPDPGCTLSHASAVCGSTAKQIMCIENCPSDFGPRVQAAPHRCWHGLPHLLAQPGPVFEHDHDAAHAAHFILPRRNVQRCADVLVDQPLHVLQVGEAVDALDPLDQLEFLLARDHQWALIQMRVGQHTRPVADAGAWRALDAQGHGGGLRACSRARL